MYGSPAMSKDLNLPFPDSPFKQGNEEADLRQAHQQQNMGSSGLLRYRTAPSNVLGDVCDDGVAAESMFARFMSPDLRDHLGGEKHPSRAPGAEGVAPAPSPSSSHTVGFPSSGPPHMFFHAQLYQQPQQIPNLSSAGSGGAESGGGSNMVRHGSSSPGLFSHLSVENGFTGIRNVGGFRSPGGSGGSSNAEAAGTTSSRLKGQISFNSRQGSVMSRISKVGSEGLGGSSPEEGGGGGGGAGRCYIPGYPVASWEDTTLLSDSFSGSKRVRDPSEVQNGEMRSYGPSLTHHLGLPKTSTEVAAMERLLQFQDAVPCKIRAKRGCATHPRSIAERMRRTRISERMRKLQELVPNMEKQTNTADMLDLAVDYIKDLQRQAKMLTESRAKCTCSSKQVDL